MPNQNTQDQQDSNQGRNVPQAQAGRSENNRSQTRDAGQEVQDDEAGQDGTNGQDGQSARGNAGEENGGQSGRGFAGMDPEEQRQIASKGGQAAHQSGAAHEFDSEEAREAGRKGGQSRSNGDQGSDEEE